MKKECICGMAGFLVSNISLFAQEMDTTKVYSLNEVVVSAMHVPRKTPVTFHNLESKLLQAGNTGQSMPYLFAGSPSLTLTSDGGSGVGYATFRIRGTDASRINFTVDGVPLNESESQGVFWVNMPDFASSVEQVQIQRGVGTSTNGSAAFGATVSMQTQKPSLKPYATIMASAGSFQTYTNTLKAGTGLLADHLVLDARYSTVKTDGYIDRARVDMDSYYASATFYHQRTLLKFQTFGSSEVSYQAWNGVDASRLKTNRRYNSCGIYDENGITKFYDNQTDNYWQHHYHLLASQHFNDKLSLNLTMHYTDGKGYYEDYKAGARYTAYQLPNFVDSTGQAHMKTDLVRRKWMRNDFYGGLFSLRYRNRTLEAIAGGAVNEYIGDHYGRVIWVKSAAKLPTPNYEYYRNRGEKLDYNIYLKTSYQILKVFNAYVDLQYRGIRYEINGSDDKARDQLCVDEMFSFFNPKVGLSYARLNHQAYASFAVAHREPSRDNFTESGSNEHPTSEQLHDWEAGYHYTHPLFQAGVNLYFMDYKDQLILNGKISEIGEQLTTNIKDSYRMGVELSAAIRFSANFRWEGNATWSQNKIRNFVEYIDTYDAAGNEQPQTAIEYGTTDIAFSPGFMLNSRFEFQLKGFSAALGTAYVGRQYLDNTSARERSLDPYFVNQLRLGYTYTPSFMDEVGIDLHVNNLFNEMYETNGWVWSYLQGGERKQESGYFTQAGTHFMLRLAIKI